MLDQRADDYQPYDWYLGCIDMITDITYKFWMSVSNMNERGEDISKEIEIQLEKEKEMNKPKNVDLAVKVSE